MIVNALNPPVRRPPKRLLLAFFGEFFMQEGVDRIPARAVIVALGGAGVSAPAARAALERMSRRGLIARARRGREVDFFPTPLLDGVLRDARARVQSPTPFQPDGSGWSLVVFSLADEPQPVRHQVRSLLAWEGFAPFGRGAWIAPGRADFTSLRAALVRHGVDDAVLAFHAELGEGFAITDTVLRVWNVESIAQRHREFLDRWGDPVLERDHGEVSPLAVRTMITADWLELLRGDPRLPREHLPESWPADESYELMARWRARLLEPSNAELRALSGA